MARPADALAANRELIRAVVQANRAENARVFGSVLHGTDTDSSDLDLLVDPLPGATTLIDLGAIQDELSERLGVTVDLLTPRELPVAWRDQVLSEAVQV